jgi:hypothetical protein
MSTFSAIHFKSVAAVLRAEVEHGGDKPTVQRIADCFVAVFRESNGWFRPGQFYHDAGLTFSGVQYTLDEDEQFFYDQAPRGTWDDDETADQARLRQAVVLAWAENRLKASPDTRVEWVAEPQEQTRASGVPRWSAFLYEGAELLGTALHQELTDVAPDKDPDRVRVISAQLALEYLPL